MANFKTSTRETLMSYLASLYKDTTELIDGSEVYHANIQASLMAAASLIQEALSICLDVTSEDMLQQFRSGDGNSYIGYVG